MSELYSLEIAGDGRWIYKGMMESGESNKSHCFSLGLLVEQKFNKHGNIRGLDQGFIGKEWEETASLIQ